MHKIDAIEISPGKKGGQAPFSTFFQQGEEQKKGACPLFLFLEQTEVYARGPQLVDGLCAAEGQLFIGSRRPRARARNRRRDVQGSRLKLVLTTPRVK